MTKVKYIFQYLDILYMMEDIYFLNNTNHEFLI